MQDLPHLITIKLLRSIKQKI